LYIIIN